jgi:hypothetical protein
MALDNDNIEDKKSSIPEKTLFQFFLETYSPTDAISRMLDKMMEIVNRLPDYHNYLAIDLISSIIREVTFQHVHEKLSNDIAENSPIHEIQRKEIQSVNFTVLNLLQQKLHKQYLNKKKITPEKAEIYCSAISDFITELTQDKETDSNYKYLKRYLPSLTQQTYREQERSVFEYLVKITKKSLKKKLKELL